MGCKLCKKVSYRHAEVRINRYIVGCKSKWQKANNQGYIELIDT